MVFDTTIKNRWRTAYCYIHPISVDTSPSRNVLINCLSSSYIFYIDNFKIFQTNAEIVTTEYNGYELTGSTLLWDGYDNNLISTDITVEVRIRANNTLVYTLNLERTSEYWLTTGCFAYPLTSDDIVFYQLEYTIKLTCWDSWFGYRSYKYITSLARIDVIGADTYSESVVNDEFQLIVSDTDTHYIRINTIITAADFENQDYFHLF